MTKLDQQFIDKNGIILLRFQKPDGGWHRTSIMPGQDPTYVMNCVNAHLQQMGHTAVSADDLSVIQNTVKEQQTPLVIAQFQASQATDLTATAVKE